MMNFWPLLAQVAPLAPVETQVAASPSAWHSIVNANPIVQLTLILLIFFSVMSWAIIGFKYLQIKRAQKHTQNFWNVFSQSKSLETISQARHVRVGPLNEIFLSALEIIPRIQKSRASADWQRAMMIQKLNQTQEEELYKMEQYLPFLATTASTAPFVGLFGTVWGILMAFSVIGKSGNSSLATVGPFISEALIATAVGLAAAIPAVMGYNYFVNKVKTISKMMDLFSEELVLRVEEENNS